MGQSPFAKRPTSADSGTGRRRSTRVDFVVPVILTGRDASGQPFREETETSKVNLHGAKLMTHHQVLVGSQLGVQNPRTEMAEKAICVWVGEPVPGQDFFEIAIQLVKAKNLWGLENPPDDWQMAEEPELRALPTPPPMAPTIGDRGTPGRAPRAQPTVDFRSADLGRRSAQIIESVLQTLRQQADEIVREAVRKFEERLEVSLAEKETRIVQRAEKAYADLESSLETLRADLADQLTALTQGVVDSAEETLRSTVTESFLRAGKAFSSRSAEGKTDGKAKD